MSFQVSNISFFDLSANDPVEPDEAAFGLEDEVLPGERPPENAEARPTTP
jgi:hypothetical protein